MRVSEKMCLGHDLYSIHRKKIPTLSGTKTKTIQILRKSNVNNIIPCQYR